MRKLILFVLNLVHSRCVRMVVIEVHGSLGLKIVVTGC